MGKSLMVYRKAKLNVCLDFSRMGSPVEKPELYRALGENRMKIQPVVSAAVVVSVSAAVVALVPNVRKLFGGFRLLAVDLVNQRALKLLSVPFRPVRCNVQSPVYHILLRSHNVYKISKGLWRMPFCSDVYVYPA